jgi:hypothetical protein
MNQIIKILRKIAIGLYSKFHKYYTLHIDKYEYKDNLYEDYFLSKVKKKTSIILDKAPEVIYVFWTGDNELTANRKIGLQSIIDKSEVEVCFVTPKNLDQYILEKFPLHPAYEYLSLIQKSDYLRCYFMLHHGGGYADIKPCLNSWKGLFEKLNSSTKWCIGLREKYVGGVPDLKGNIGIDCRKYHNILIRNSGGYVYKPNSPIAQEWMNEIHARLDFFMPELKKNPGDAFGSDNYPIPWAYLEGFIMATLILKYHDKVIRLDMVLYSTKNYR